MGEPKIDERLAESGPGERRRPDAPNQGPPRLVPGTRLEGIYEVKHLLGQGAMGAVYLVEHVGLGKQFAAKVVAPSRALDESASDRLRNEARITSAIDHENIVNVTHLGATADGGLFIVMELLRGETLGARMARQRELAATGEPAWLPDEEVRTHVSALLSALAAAHTAGVVHRDLKPDNVFLSKTAAGKTRLKIVDFGIGKLTSPTASDPSLTETGQTLGTPLYMSPEQFKPGSPIGPRTDIYALGVMMFEMLTGELPICASHAFELAVKHATERARDPRELRPSLPAAVAEVAKRCLEKEADARFPNAEALQVAWRKAWSGHEVVGRAGRETPHPTASPVVASSAQRWIAVTALALGVATLAGLAFVTGNTSDAHPPPPAVVEAPTVVAEPPAEVMPAIAPERPVRVHHVTSEPTGAELFVEGVRVGQTPFDLSVRANATTVVSFRLPGRRRVVRTLDANTPIDVDVRLARERSTAFPSLADR